jgi:hypothetical protein
MPSRLPVCLRRWACVPWAGMLAGDVPGPRAAVHPAGSSGSAMRIASGFRSGSGGPCLAMRLWLAEVTGRPRAGPGNQYSPAAGRRHRFGCGRRSGRTRPGRLQRREAPGCGRTARAWCPGEPWAASRGGSRSRRWGRPAASAGAGWAPEPSIAAGPAQPAPSACWSSGQARCRSRCQYGQSCVPAP